jgi:hypothetical protein
LFGTHLLRGRRDASRWRDPVWLSWLAVPVYLVHQFEEYGIAANGFHQFPTTLCTQMGLGDYPDCPIPGYYFAAVNLSLAWVGAPLAAYLSRRSTLVGLSFYGLILVNGLVHILPAVTGELYNPGMITAVLVLLPLGAWAARAVFGAGRPGHRELLVLVVGGVVFHVVLVGFLLLFINGVIGGVTLALVETLNGFTLPAVAFLGRGRPSTAAAGPNGPGTR